MCYAPVCHSLILRLATSDRAFDLHALATPPAFILSQDQTLNNNSSVSCDTKDLLDSIA